MVKKISKKRLESLKGGGALVLPNPKIAKKAKPVEAPPEKMMDIAEKIDKNIELSSIQAGLDDIKIAMEKAQVIAPVVAPVSKIKVRNITRCNKGRMKDADLIIEREAAVVH